jgi:Membrane bound O-acyl transferase family
MQYTRPSLEDPAGDTLFDLSLTLIPRYAKAAFLGTCSAVVVYTTVDVLYHFATLIGRLLIRQPDWAWPPLSDRPWTSMSIIEYWSFRWHQFFRRMFVVYGARSGGALLGKPGGRTIVWNVGWGTLMIDGWVRRGIVASDFFPDRHRPGKWPVDTIIAFSSEWR